MIRGKGMLRVKDIRICLRVTFVKLGRFYIPVKIRRHGR